MSTRTKLALFVLLALVQLGATGTSILAYERVLSEGTRMRFSIDPRDPIDTLRGNYIALRFDAAQMPWSGERPDDYDTPYYATLEVDEAGFAKVRALHAQRPAEGTYLRVRVTGYQRSRPDDASPLEEQLFLELPFGRYYVNAHKAHELERLFFEAHAPGGNTRRAYVEVRVAEGRGVIESLVIVPPDPR